MTAIRTRTGVLALAALLGAGCGGDDDDDVADSSTDAPAESVATTTGDTVAEGFVFEGPEGDYTIVLPGEPQSIPQEVPLPDGTTLPITFHLYEEADFAAGVARFEYPAGSPLSLEGTRDGAVASLEGAELTDSASITQQGRDGLQFVVDVDPDGVDGTYISRVFLDENVLYQIIYVGQDVAAADAEVVAVLDSFQFTEG